MKNQSKVQEGILLSIVTPALNEEKILEGFIDKAVSFIKQRKLAGEIIVVENGSNDSTLVLANKLAKKHRDLIVYSIPEGNKGKALRTGIEKSNGDLIVTLDTDLWDENFVDQSIKHLGTYDIVVGSKNAPGADDQRSFINRLVTKAYNFCFSLVFNLKATDTKARIAFKRQAILPIVSLCKTEDLIFDTELLIRSERAGLQITEVPGSVKEIRAQRYSIKSRWRKILRDFFTLLKVLRPSPNWSYVTVFLAVLIGAFLRFYNYESWFFFEVDEEHYSFMTRMITENHHFPLIGGPISGTKLYMAPWFLYFSSVWYFVSGNSPIFFGIITTLFGLGTIWLIYLVGKKIYSPAAGAIGALLYSSSFLMVLFDRHQWNVTLLPLISIATIYFLIRWLEGGRKWLIFAAIVVTFGISSTFTAFAVFLFALTIIVFGKRPWLKKDLLIFFGVVGIGHLPLVLFDLRHDLWLTRAFIDFLTHPTYAAVPLVSRISNTLTLLFQSLGKALLINYPLDLADESSICTRYVTKFVSSPFAILGSAIFVAGYFKLMLTRKLSRYSWILVLALIINVLSLVLFRADPSERHWLPFYPLYFLMVAVILNSLFGRSIWQKAHIVIVVGAVVLLNSLAFISSWSSYGWKDKNAAVNFIINNTNPQKFYLAAVGDACHEWGYRYQFSQLKHEPAGSYIDYDFSWMYKNKPTPEDAGVRATIIAPNKNIPERGQHTMLRHQLMESSYKQKTFGNVEVYLEKIK